MNWYAQLQTDLQNAVKAAWPDVTAVWKVQQIERIHFLNEMTAGTITPPWAVIQIGTAHSEPGWGVANITYRPEITVFRIDANTPPDAQGTVRGKLTALQDYLLTNGFSSFQIPNDVTFTLDDSPEFTLPDLFLDTNLQLVGSGLVFDVLVGFVSTIGES